MGDIQRIVRLPDGGRKRAQVLLDLADLVAFTPTRGSWQYTAPPKKATTADANRRYGGSREVANTHDNATLTRSFIVKGTNADAVLGSIERLRQELEDFEGKYFEWRPDGASHSGYLELRGTATVADKYANPQFAQARSIEVDVSFPIAPLGRGDACDFTEDWSGTNPLSDYVNIFSTSVQEAVVGGALASTANHTQFRYYSFRGRGHMGRDSWAMASFVVPQTLTGFVGGVRVGELDPVQDNGVPATVEDDGSASTLYVKSVVNGVVIQSQTAALTRLVAGQTIWVAIRMEGYVCTAEFFTAPPGPASTPTATASITLASASEKALADNPTRAGIRWTPVDSTARVLGFQWKPWSYKLRPLPEVQSLRDVPGTAPPLFEAHLTPSGGAVPPIFALLGWWRRPATFNWCWNGGFEENLNGWSASAVSGFNGAATDITHTAGTPSSPAKFGQWYARIVTPATANVGANFKLYRRFRKGRTYTFDLWVRSSAAQNAQLQVGNEAGTDVATGTSTALSTTGWTLLTVAWTPTAHADVAYIAVRQVNATAVNLDVDGADVYEGTVAPTTNQHAEGKGAQPPVGIIQAESQDQANLSGWALAADATYLAGYGLYFGFSSPGSAQATWLVDPALIEDDDFADGEVHLEAWARIELGSGGAGTRLALSAFPESGAGAERYADVGAVGKSVIAPASGIAKRFVRLGVIRLPTTDQQRWRLRLRGSWTTGTSFGIDYLVLVPGRRRAASPNAKANDASYPDFTSSTAEITRRVLPDLSGQTIKEPGYPSVDTGLGGVPLELPAATPGATARDVDVVVKLSSLVPDDPTLDATTEQLSHDATCHFGVVPRYFLTRPS
jgi:hypothetical protein